MKYVVIGILLFAVGLSVLFWTKSVRTQSEIQLKNEEKIAEAKTRQVMTERKIQLDYESSRQRQAR